MAFSIRLDPATEKAIARLARLRRQTKAAVVREALAAWEIHSRSAARPRTAAEALAPFIGVVHSRGSHRSERTGEAFRALVERKRARRTR
jgi:hypothetical protein